MPACTSPSTRAATGFRIAEEFGDDETGAVQRQLISGYIEGFLQREHTGPEHLEELLSTLQKADGRRRQQRSGAAGIDRSPDPRGRSRAS